MKIRAILVILWLSEMYCKESALKEKFVWGKLDFQFPNSSAKNKALSTGTYVPLNNNIYAVGVWKDKIFVSIFRLKIGVISSFNYFSAQCRDKSPVLIPYPSFDANYVNEDPQDQTVTLPSEESIINSGYFRIDYKCDRLWIIDDGTTDFFGNKRRIAPPAVVIFDLTTNKLIRRYTIPAEFINSETTFTSLEVDIKGSGCIDAFAYVTDLFRSLTVYSFKKNRSWRLTHNYFGSDPDAANFNYEGVNFQWNFGILGVTLGESHNNGSRRVYIKPFASTKAYYISNKVLQNEAYILLNNYFYDVHLLGDGGPKGHVYEFAYDNKTKVLFAALFNQKRITCWNTSVENKNSNFGVVYKGKKLFFSIDIIIDDHRNLWAVSNNYPKFAYGPWNPNDRNMRIYSGKVDKLIAGTVCDN